MGGFKTKEEVENAAILDIISYVNNISEWQVAKRAWMTGFAAGVKVAEERILNEFFDRYGAEEHAKFALSVDAYQNIEEDK